MREGNKINGAINDSNQRNGQDPQTKLTEINGNLLKKIINSKKKTG